MEQLDLAKHDIDEYAGKLVSINGAEYIIGEGLGAGMEKAGHKLFNRRSGISLHVIKLFHYAEEARLFGPGNRAEIFAKSRRVPMLRNAIPVSLFFEANGGCYEVQSAVYGYERAKKADGVDQLMDKAGELMEKKDYASARGIYAQVLNTDQTHTVALHNLALAHAQLGNYSEASQIEGVAVSLEPNYIDYRLAHIRYQASTGNLSAALMSCESLKSKFPYIHDADEMAIELYLLAGCPERAEAILRERMISDEGIAKFADEIANALVMKSQATALAAKAKDILMSDVNDDAGVLRLLEQAHKTYDKDVFLTMNLAFALGRTAKFEAAWKALMSVLSIVPLGYYNSCMANVSYNLIKQGEFALSMTLLDTTMQSLRLLGPELHFADLPGVGVWIEPKNLVEERIQSAAKLIEHAIAQCPDREKVTAGVRELCSLYQKAALSM